MAKIQEQPDVYRPVARFQEGGGGKLPFRGKIFTFMFFKQIFLGTIKFVGHKKVGGLPPTNAPLATGLNVHRRN